jgi:hypothetical protein
MEPDPATTAPEAASGAAPDVEVESAAAPAGGSSVGDALRWLVIAACAGSAAIHFAYAPTHLDEDTAHGIFFLGVAWGQLGVAFALSRWRAARAPWLVAAGLNAAVAAVWALSRTVGVPGSDGESVGFPDLLATGLEVVALAGALLAVRPALAARPVARLHPAVAGVAALALVGVVSASVTPSIAGDHGHTDGHDSHAATAEGESAGGDGHDHGDNQDLAAVAREDRCDLAFNTAEFNEVSVPGVPHAHDDGELVDFTLEEWADVFVDPANGLPADVVVDYIEQNQWMRDGILTGGLTHTLDPDPWNPITDPDECEALAGELQRAKEVAATYPTVADAEAAGYHKVTNYFPGIAAHYMKFSNLDDGFVLEAPEMLLYDGTNPTSGIVGLSYYIIQPGEEEPAEGFTADNDHYHRHVGLCIKDGVVAAGSNTSEEECGALGGEKADGTAAWMSHVWIAPGCESDWGIFSGANPALSVRAPGDTRAVPSGCGTGMTMDDALAFDDDTGGPSLR